MVEDAKLSESPSGAKVISVTESDFANDSAPTEKKEEEKKDPRQGLPTSVKVESASAPMKLRTPDPKAKGPWIQYNGVGTVRIMTQPDWAQAGVDSNKYCEWNYLNKKRLPRNIFTDDELQYLLRVDGRFSLVDE
jgi:hypothetical protein